MKPITHVLLAGDKDYKRYLLENRNKCFLEFSGRRLIDLSLAAFARASEVQRLVVIGPSELQDFLPKAIKNQPVTFLLQRESLSENVAAALKIIEQRWPGGSAIFVTNDTPLMSGVELDRFATAVRGSHEALCIGVNRIACDDINDPLVKRYVRSMVLTSDGLYLLANQIALRTSEGSLLRVLQKLFDVRKQSWWLHELRTLLYALMNPQMRRGIISWLRLVTAKRVWLMKRTSKLSLKISLSTNTIAMRLADVLECESGVAIIENPQGLGCFDADTDDQLFELRRVLDSTAKPLTALEAKHA